MVYFQKSTNVRGIHTQTHTQKHTGSGDRAIDWREVRRKNEGGRRGKRERGGVEGWGRFETKDGFLELAAESGFSRREKLEVEDRLTYYTHTHTHT